MMDVPGELLVMASGPLRDQEQPQKNKKNLLICKLTHIKWQQQP